MKNRFVKRTYLEVSQVPLVNADKVTGLSMVVLFVLLRTFINFSDAGYVPLVRVILAHIVFSTPYVVLAVLPRLARMDNNLYEAALDLGATPTKAIRKVLLPQLRPGILIGFAMAIMVSIDDFIITQINLTGGRETLSTFIFSSIRGKSGLPPEVRALSSLIFLRVSNSGG
jgi:spermidine/putrescine transport system permease protein